MDRVSFDKIVTDKDKELICNAAAACGMKEEDALDLVAAHTVAGKLIMDKDIRNLFNVKNKPFINEEKMKMKEEKNKRLREK